MRFFSWNNYYNWKRKHNKWESIDINFQNNEHLRIVDSLMGNEIYFNYFRFIVLRYYMEKLLHINLVFRSLEFSKFILHIILCKI